MQWNQINEGILVTVCMIITFSRFTAWPSDENSLLWFQQLFTSYEKEKVVATLDTQSLEGPLRYASWIFTERNSKTMLFKATNNAQFVCAPFWPQALEMPTLRGYLADRLNIIIKLFSINRTGGLKMMKCDCRVSFVKFFWILKIKDTCVFYSLSLSFI